MEQVTQFTVYPSRIGRPGTFSADGDSLLEELPLRIAEANALGLGVNRERLWAEEARDAAQTARAGSEDAQGASESARDESIANARGVVAAGSSKDWAIKTGGPVADTEYSSRAYASGEDVPGGSSKEWATKTGSPVADTEYSSRAYASGVGVPGGSSKEWAETAEGFAAQAEAAVAVLPPGTIDDLMIASDKAWSSQKVSDELALVTPIENKEIITTTSFFIVPAEKIKVKIWGGGGSGRQGSSTTGFANAAGGAAGGYAEKIISGLTIGASISVTIGNGGIGQTVADTDGNAGQTTSFGAYCSATGGAGGTISTSAISSGGTGVNGDINLKGDDCIFVDSTANNAQGGSAPMSGGITSQRLSAAQNAASFPGGGSPGSKSGVSTLAGGKGLCIVEW